jgi:cytoskeletal protein CcmA (bactofilin family)
VVVEGSLVSRGDLTVGTGAWVRGPVICEEELHLSSGVTIGTLATPTTVSARTIVMASGAVVCGHVVTEAGGQTEG